MWLSSAGVQARDQAGATAEAEGELHGRAQGGHHPYYYLIIIIIIVIIIIIRLSSSIIFIFIILQVCTRSRVNPRKVKKPIVKKWCYVSLGPEPETDSGSKPQPATLPPPRTCPAKCADAVRTGKWCPNYLCGKYFYHKNICRRLRPELRAVRGRVRRVRAPAHVSRALRCCRGLRRLRPELRRVRGRVRPLHPRVSPEMRGNIEIKIEDTDNKYLCSLCPQRRYEGTIVVIRMF